MFALYADIHNLATSQAAYFTDHARYMTEFGAYYAPTHGTTVRVAHANDTAWTATATHPSTSRTCSITYAEPRGATQAQVVEARVAAWKTYDCR
jgi:hypothetical protein